MTVALESANSEDLGGQFRFNPHPAHRDVIEAGALTAFGFQAIMSPSGVNARERAEFRAWAEESIPGVGSRLRSVDQVHGASVVGAESLRDGHRVEADGVITHSPQDAAVVMAADCAPVWIADPASGVIALVHAGWRGVAAGVIEAGVRALVAGSTKPQHLIVAVGPHLQACCFEIGPELAVQFPAQTRPASTLLVERKRPDSVALDLASAIDERLSSQGVLNIHISHACTRCRSDILHSYRRNGKGGPLMGAIGVVASGSR